MDVLRFIAFLLVFCHHTPKYPTNHPVIENALSASRAGLCLFFLLSAYLITELLIRERDQTKTIHIKAFFLRRALRIWPLYFSAVAVSYFLGQFSNSWHIRPIALPYLLILATNIFIAHYGWQMALIAPLWSLSIEEQFYLIIPGLVKTGGTQVLKWMAWLCLLVSYSVLLWLGYIHAHLVDVVWVNSFVQFQFFAAGTLIALIFHKREWRVSWQLRWILLLLGIASVYIGEEWFHLLRRAPGMLPDVVIGYALMLFGCIAFFLAFLKAPLRAPAWVTYLGRISYGLYVFHGFVIGMELALLNWERKHGKSLSVLLTHTISLPLTILLAALSFRYFEQPILKFKERFSYVKSGVESASRLRRERDEMWMRKLPPRVEATKNRQICSYRTSTHIS